MPTDVPTWKYQPISEGRFSAWQWTLHYTGISRIVYEPTWERWHIRPNGYHPLLYVVLAVALPVMPFFSRQTMGDTLSDIWEVVTCRDEWLWNLYETDDNGEYKYMSRRQVSREGIPAK